jgi:hypothetical protein
VKKDDGTQAWKLTGFYGHPESARRADSWVLLKHLKSLQPAPWLCVGDLNEILEPSEKVGGVLRRESHMDGFQTAFEECCLCDLGYKGPRFTWSNKRQDGSFTNERLDRAVANLE